MGNSPLKSFKSGDVNIAVFDNEKTYSIKISKRYKAKDGAWRDTSNYFPQELAGLKDLVSQVIQYVNTLPEKDYKHSGPEKDRSVVENTPTPIQDDDPILY